MTIDDAKKALGDPSQAARDQAAVSIKQAIAADPKAAGDPGEAFWKTRLATVPMGISQARFEELLGAKGEGAVSSGQSTTAIFRLDDYWMVETYFSHPDKLREIGPLSRRARHVWVDPAKDFTGRWVTYFVNGSMSHDIQYRKGTYERFTAYYDNGQRIYEQRYLDGKIDGAEIGHHPDGSKAYEIHHAAGKHTGTWVHWFPNGRKQSEETYVNGELDGISMRYREDGSKQSRMDYKAGKETGQAAWDEKGVLLYSRGTAEQK